MTFKENVRAILDCNLTEIKDEIKDCITDRIVLLKSKEIVYHGISDINDVKDWRICGYSVEELYKLTLILKGKRIEDCDLRDYNACFFEGYKRAVEDNERAIQETIDRMFTDIKKEDQ